MRIGIIGGGTSGLLASIHLSQRNSGLDLAHIVGKKMVGSIVGEGTTPIFLEWIKSVCNFSIDDLAKYCEATAKRGIHFSGWGTANDSFYHSFVPEEKYAVHFSSRQLPQLLKKISRSTIVEDDVVATQSLDNKVNVELAGGESLNFDFVVNARGFPSQIDCSEEMQYMPTNAALVSRISSSIEFEFTKAIAKENGWIFVIPLKNDTSVGYVYNAALSTENEIKIDLEKFLKIEFAQIDCVFKNIPFPNFIKKSFCADRIFHIGNAMSFIEPLEATSIASTIYQINLISSFLELMTQTGVSYVDTNIARETLNSRVFDQLIQTSHFVLWHYIRGSIHETPFWKLASESAATKFENLSLIESKKFQAMLTTSDVLNGTSYGGFSKSSFGSMSKGLGINQ